MDNLSCSTPRPSGVDSLLDGDNSWEKTSLLFFAINILEAEHKISGSVDHLGQTIIYAEELTKVLAAEQTPLHYGPTTATAMELLMGLLEQKMDQKSGINHLTKLIEAARAHLELVAPAKPPTTLGRLGIACAQHYHLTEDRDILLEAIKNLQLYLKKAEDSDVASTMGKAAQVLDPNQARSPGPGSSNDYCHSRPHESDGSKSPQKLYLSARLAVVKCLQEAYRIEREVDILNQLIFECDYSLKVFSSGSHHREIQQILKFAIMQRYFRRTASDGEPQQFSPIGLSPTAEVPPTVISDISAHPTSPTPSISESLYNTHKLSQWSKEFRLLKLHPGKQNDPIICTLEVSDLDADPAYDVSLFPNTLEASRD